MAKKSSPMKKQKYSRQLLGSDDDSEYDYWTDDEISDVVPRRWPPAPLTKQGTLEEKRIEKNMKRKIVPALDIKPELREKILAMRVLQEREAREAEDSPKSKKPSKGEKRRNPKRKTRRPRRGRKQSTSEDSTDEESEPLECFEEEERPPTQEIVLQELRVEGPAGKQARKIKVLARPDVDQEVAAIVVEPPTPQPEEPPKQPVMVSLLKTGGSSLLRPGGGGQSLLKTGGGVSLLKPREPKRPEPSCEWKAPTPAPPQDMFERHPIDFDEGPLQTPQPPRIED